MIKLAQIQKNLLKYIKKVAEFQEMENLGFTIGGKLCEYIDYENFYERLWAFYKVDKNDLYIVVMADESNGYGSVIYTDLYVKEIIELVNKE